MAGLRPYRLNLNRVIRAKGNTALQVARRCGIEKAPGTHQNGFWLLVMNHQEKEGEVFQVAAPVAIVPY